jgi:hypothetical protein
LSDGEVEAPSNQPELALSAIPAQVRLWQALTLVVKVCRL